METGNVFITKDTACCTCCKAAYIAKFSVGAFFLGGAARLNFHAFILVIRDEKLCFYLKI